jgi:hypothetical protein
MGEIAAAPGEPVKRHRRMANKAELLAILRMSQSATATPVDLLAPMSLH